jgi:hypothetical protein
MKKRGKVLRDATSGPGLLIIEGQQYRFSREDAWKSEEPPRTGLVVDVQLDDRGKVNAITVVPESQLILERAESARLKERKAISAFLARVGLYRLAATALLAAAWFFLTAISMQVPFPGKLEFTFWQLLGFVNARDLSALLDGQGSAGGGLYGLAAAIALGGPFLPGFWKDNRAFLGGLLPLAFMLVTGIAARGTLRNALGGMKDGIYTGASRTISLDLGAYFSILVGLFLAFLSARDLVAARAHAKQDLGLAQRKAA